MSRGLAISALLFVALATRSASAEKRCTVVSFAGSSALSLRRDEARQAAEAAGFTFVDDVEASNVDLIVDFDGGRLCPTSTPGLSTPCPWRARVNGSTREGKGKAPAEVLAALEAARGEAFELKVFGSWDKVVLKSGARTKEFTPPEVPKLRCLVSGDPVEWVIEAEAGAHVGQRKEGASVASVTVGDSSSSSSSSTSSSSTSSSSSSSSGGCGGGTNQPEPWWVYGLGIGAIAVVIALIRAKGPNVLVPVTTPHLSDADLDEVEGAAVALGLADQRDELLANIRADYVAALPRRAPTPRAQLKSDLACLNRSKLDDGSIPLRRWLVNAEGLSGGNEQGLVFRLKRATIDGEPLP